MNQAIATLLNAGMERHRAGDLSGAATAYQEVLRQMPQQADALHLLGVVSDQQGAHEEAVALIAQAIAIAPGEASFHGNLGTALLALQRHDEAEAAYRQAVRLDPAYTEGHYNLANLLRGTGAAEEARRHFEAALAQQPGHAQARNNLAMLLWEDMGETAAAEQHYRILRQIAPDWATGRMNHGVFCLAQGDHRQGWREYEWRWRSETYPERDWGMGLPRWDGRHLGEAGLLVWGEQGVGDQILYGTMLADAQRLCGGGMIVAVDARLVDLFARSLSGSGAAVVVRGEPVQAAMQCPFGSLGTLLRQAATDFAGKGRYLRADPERREDIRRRYLSVAGGRQLIGLSWRSGNRSIGRHKSIPLPQLAPPLHRRDILWVNLQYGEVREDLTFLRQQGVDILDDESIDSLRDMDGFAAQVAALDSVLTVSNTAVHVAGALGVPARLLLPRGRGRLWYWPGEGDSSLWYDSVRIFRQKAPDDWTEVLRDLEGKLDLAAPRSANG